MMETENVSYNAPLLMSMLTQSPGPAQNIVT
jgi:hypothetical protein